MKGLKVFCLNWYHVPQKSRKNGRDSTNTSACTNVVDRGELTVFTACADSFLAEKTIVIFSEIQATRHSFFQSKPTAWRVDYLNIHYFIVVVFRVKVKSNVTSLKLFQGQMKMAKIIQTSSTHYIMKTVKN